MLDEIDGSPYRSRVSAHDAVSMWLDRKLTPLHRLIYDDVELVFRDPRLLVLDSLLTAGETTDVWEIAMDTNVTADTAEKLVGAGRHIAHTVCNVLSALARIESEHPEVAEAAKLFRESLERIRDKVEKFGYDEEIARGATYADRRGA